MSVITFDATFYLAQNPDVAAAVANGSIPSAQFHFEQFGQFELRDPNEFFDSEYYLSTNADVLRAVANGSIESAFSHFVDFGQAEGAGRAPAAEFEGFDDAAYLAANPDVAAAVQAGFFANGFQHFVQFGVEENRPGTGIDETSDLGATLEAIAAAEVAAEDAIEDAALALNAEGRLSTTGTFQDPADEPLTGDDLAAAVAEFDETDFDGAVAGATVLVNTERSDLTTASNALATDRQANGSDSALNANLATARTALSNDTTNAPLLAARDRADAALEADIGRDGSNEALLVNLRAAIGQFVVAGGDSSVTTVLNTDAATAPTVAAILAEIDAALALTDPDAREADIEAVLGLLGGDTALELSAAGGGSAAARTVLTTSLNVASDRDDLIEAQTTAEGNLAAAAGDAEVDAFLAAETAVDDRQDLIDAEAEAQADLADALALLQTLQGFEAIVDAPEALFAAAQAEFGPINILDGVADDATTEDDIFILDPATATASIDGFGEAGDDVLFVGRGYSLVDITATVTPGTTAAGNAGALEIFVRQESNGDVTLFIEEETFDGSTTTGFGGTVVTLEGVDADDVTVDANGFLRLEPELVA